MDELLRTKPEGFSTLQYSALTKGVMSMTELQLSSLETLADNAGFDIRITFVQRPETTAVIDETGGEHDE